MKSSLTQRLINQNYSPALALKALESKDYLEVIRRCRSYLRDYPKCISAGIILARALFHNGQIEEAENYFYRILRVDPENMVALKYIGDIRFNEGDEVTAMAYYSRVLKIEPFTAGLSSPYSPPHTEKTRVISLKRGPEETVDNRLAQLLFKTETMGDLLLKQGHPRLALAVFKELVEKTGNPGIREKYEKTKTALNGGEDKNA